MGYARSPFRDFESYLRIVVGPDDGDFQLILKHYNSNFVTYDLSPRNYSIGDISEAVYSIGDNEGTLQVEYDDAMKKLILKRFVGTFGTLRFNEKSFLNTLLGFTPYWNYKPTNAIHADSPGVYTSDEILNSSGRGKILLKCDVIDGNIANGTQVPILFSFILDKPSGYKLSCEPETINFKKINKSILNTISLHLEEVNFIGETLTCTLQMIKNYTNK